MGMPDWAGTAKLWSLLTEVLCGAQKDDPWTVRMLPKVYFGVHPLGLDGVSPDDPDIVVLHHFLGSWKVRGGWNGSFGVGQLLRRAAGFFSRSIAPEPCDPILRFLPSQGQGCM